MANVSGRTEELEVEVAYATPAVQVVRVVRVAPGTTVRRVIDASGVLQSFPEIDLAVNAVGIFGERVRLDQVVQHADRIEIYRPLVADAKQAPPRRQNP